jgi:hypothetical protein
LFWRRTTRRLNWAAVASHGLGALVLFLLLGVLIPFAPEGVDRQLGLNAAVGAAYLGLHLDPALTAVGLGVSAVSHYVADRRAPLRRIADALGKRRFVRVAAGGINGAYLLDQAWHRCFLVWSALIIAAGPDRLPLTVAIGLALTIAIVVKVRRDTHGPRPGRVDSTAAAYTVPAPRAPITS